jgi:hypothetical protein
LGKYKMAKAAAVIGCGLFVFGNDFGVEYKNI